MGLWQNTAYFATERIEAVRDALAAQCETEGRALISPLPRQRDDFDEMQYGGAISRRWGFAVFAGAPGWCVVKSAPMDILLFGTGEPRLASLARRLGCAGFQHSVYDGTADVLVEVDAAGRVTTSGHSGYLESPFVDRDPDRADPRFAIIDVDHAARAARDRGVSTVTYVIAPDPPRTGIYARAVGDAVLARNALKRQWIRELGGRAQQIPAAIDIWRVSAADVVETLGVDRPRIGIIGETTATAIALVFAGDNAGHADNTISVENLVCHTRLPVRPSAVVYADASSSR